MNLKNIICKIFGHAENYVVDDNAMMDVNISCKRCKKKLSTETIVDMAASLTCPVCGYFCKGNGGYGCLDKPKIVEQAEKIYKECNETSGLQK